MWLNLLEFCVPPLHKDLDSAWPAFCMGLFPGFGIVAVKPWLCEASVIHCMDEDFWLWFSTSDFFPGKESVLETFGRFPEILEMINWNGRIPLVYLLQKFPSMLGWLCSEGLWWGRKIIAEGTWWSKGDCPVTSRKQENWKGDEVLVAVSTQGANNLCSHRNLWNVLPPHHSIKSGNKPITYDL